MICYSEHVHGALNGRDRVERWRKLQLAVFGARYHLKVRSVEGLALQGARLDTLKLPGVCTRAVGLLRNWGAGWGQTVPRSCPHAHGKACGC